MCKDTSLLQRSNISIEKPVSPLALQRSAMFEVLENGVTKAHSLYMSRNLYV